jgi:hypothetical protein
MRFPTFTDSLDYQTQAVEDAHGPQDHGFTDGDAVLYDETMQVAGNATKVPARWFTDVTLGIKYACREGNGERGPESGDVADDPYELARAVNTAANVLTGTSGFVASGLEFDTDTASLTVELSAGSFVFNGRKYHATEDRLEDIIVMVDGAEAGNGNSFVLLASRVHYVSIGPDGDDALSITVQDVAIGDSAPAPPAGEVMIAALTTNGSGVIVGGLERIGYARILAGNDGQGLLRLRYVGLSAGGTVLEPFDFQGGATLGSRSSYDSPEALGGNFWTVLYVEEVQIRSYTDAGHTSDRTRTFSRRTSTAGAVNATMNVLDLDDYPNSSVVEIEVTVVGRSHLNQHYTRTFRQMARKTSAGAMALEGSLREVSVDDPGALGCAAIFIATAEGDNSLIQVRVTGAATHNIEWTARITTVESWGS